MKTKMATSLLTTIQSGAIMAMPSSSRVAPDVSVMLATDLGGRGLDIDRIERVVNAFLPQQIDNYLHRVGRTARAGRAGVVVNLVTPRDQPLLARLKKRNER